MNYLVTLMKHENGDPTVSGIDLHEIIEERLQSAASDSSYISKLSVREKIDRGGAADIAHLEKII
jgi:hypothetical protein